MVLSRTAHAGIVALSLVLMNDYSAAGAQTKPDLAVPIGDIGGRVAGPHGPEAGIWVIAETTDLPTKFAKTVVTDDNGRFVIPELPSANYKIWSRGYGLIDSDKQDVRPGQTIEIMAKPAPSDAAAA